MCRATEVATALSSTPYPHPDTISLVSSMKEFNNNMKGALSLLDITANPLQHRTQAQMQSEYVAFIDSYARFVTAVVPELTRLGCLMNLTTACRIGTAEEEVFWEWWSLLATSNSAVDLLTAKWEHVYPAGQQPYQAALYHAFHSLLTWMLSMSRSPAWLAMRVRHGRAQRDLEVLLILKLSAEQMQQLSALDEHQFSSHVSQLPGNFLPLLCCLASEQLTTAPLLMGAQPRHFLEVPLMV